MRSFKKDDIIVPISSSIPVHFNVDFKDLKKARVTRDQYKGDHKVNIVPIEGVMHWSYTGIDISTKFGVSTYAEYYVLESSLEEDYDIY